jgi:hypothetical protein
MMKYILILFAKSTHQDEFVQSVAIELGNITPKDDVCYYYGEESIIFTFESKENLDFLKEYIDDMLSGLNLVYMFTPYQPEFMTFNLPDNISKFLFEPNSVSGKQDYLPQNFDDLDSEIIEKIQSLKKEISQLDMPIEKSDLSLNELLDKINEIGISNLTQKELQLLDNYSNQI